MKPEGIVWVCGILIVFLLFAMLHRCAQDWEQDCISHGGQLRGRGYSSGCYAPDGRRIFLGSE